LGRTMLPLCGASCPLCISWTLLNDLKGPLPPPPLLGVFLPQFVSGEHLRWWLAPWVLVKMKAYAFMCVGLLLAWSTSQKDILSCEEAQKGGKFRTEGPGWPCGAQKHLPEDKKNRRHTELDGLSMWPC
jgi:hypothetical protein